MVCLILTKFASLTQLSPKLKYANTIIDNLLNINIHSEDKKCENFYEFMDMPIMQCNIYHKSYPIFLAQMWRA